MARKNFDKWLPWTLLLLLACTWGSSYILMKKGLQVFTPQEVGALRVVAAATFLLPLSLPQLLALRWRHYPLLLASGLLGTFFPAFVYAKAQVHLDSAIAGALNALTPISVLLVSALFFRKRVSTNEMLGALIGVLGTAILVFVDNQSYWRQMNYYFLLPILGGFLYANNSNLVKYCLPELRATTIASVSLLLVGVLMALILFTQTPFVTKLQTVNGACWAAAYVLVLGTMGSGVALILYSKIVLLRSPIFANVVSFLIPLVACFWGLLDGEVLVLGHYVGIVTILVGVYLVSRQQRW